MIGLQGFLHTAAEGSRVQPPEARRKYANKFSGFELS